MVAKPASAERLSLLMRKESGELPPTPGRAAVRGVLRERQVGVEGSGERAWTVEDVESCSPQDRLQPEDLGPMGSSDSLHP